MKVKLIENQNVIFKEIITRNGKNGAFQLVVLADMDNVEKFDFFLRDDLNIDGLVQGEKVNAVFTLSKRGYQTVVDLVQINKNQVK